MIGLVGASGFIGRSIADHLNARDVPYAALMRQPDAVPDGAFTSAKRIARFAIGGDMDKAAFDGVDTAVLVGWATKPGSEHGGFPGEIGLNVRPYTELLTDLAETGVQHLIFISSGGAVYGNVDQSERIDEDHICTPTTSYGYGKLCTEKAIEGFWAPLGRRYTIVRPSNPVGLHQVQSAGVHGLFPSVLTAMLNNRHVRVFGDGTTVRDYFAVEDLADLVLKVAQSDGGNTVVNAASGAGMSVNEVIGICEDAVGCAAQRDILMDRQPNIAYNVLNIDRAHRLFDWQPTRDVSDVAAELVSAMRRTLR